MTLLGVTLPPLAWVYLVGVPLAGLTSDLFLLQLKSMRENLMFCLFWPALLPVWLGSVVRVVAGIIL